MKKRIIKKQYICKNKNKLNSMRKFTDFAKSNPTKRTRRIFEQEITLNQPNQEQGTQNTQQTGTQPIQVEVEVEVPGQNMTLQGTKSNDTQTKQAQAQPEPQKAEPAKFFSKLFESREMAHVYHLQVKGDMGSHAAHTALQEYYEGIIGFIDEMIEVYQGQYQIIEGYDIIDTKETNSKDKIEYFTDLTKFIKETRFSCLSQEDSHLQNIVDEVIAHIYKLLYKLKYNK